jgi:hypothetical protein
MRMRITSKMKRESPFASGREEKNLPLTWGCVASGITPAFSYAQQRVGEGFNEE